MAIPLLHHGMLITGIPYTEPELSSTTTGGSPYGATHISWNRKADSLSTDEISLARKLGARIARTALKLSRD
jgi:NAD(P)H dehydrogenase (quinone)